MEEKQYLDLIGLGYFLEKLRTEIGENYVNMNDIASLTNSEIDNTWNQVFPAVAQ